MRPWSSVLFSKFDIQVTVHRDEFLTIKPTRCTNFWNLFLEWKSTCFGQFLCPSSGFFHCTHSNGISHRGLLTAYEQVHDRTAFYPNPACMSKIYCHIFAHKSTHSPLSSVWVWKCSSGISGSSFITSWQREYWSSQIVAKVLVEDFLFVQAV